MATRTVKARVELDGEKQYKQALSDLNKGNQVLASEMKKLQAQYKGNTESTEFLTKKGDLLDRQLLQQREKVQSLRDALKNSADQFGESSAKTQDWQIKLNNAEAAQYELEAAIRDNNEALENSSRQMENTQDVSQNLSLSVRDLASQFGVKLPGGLDKALNSMKRFSSGSVAAVSAVAAVVTTLIAAEKKLVDLTREAAAGADDILTLAKITGLDTKTIQEYQYAAQLLDVSFETVQGSLTKLKRAQDKARDGNKELINTFRLLNVEYMNTDGTLRNTEDVFMDAIDALGGIESAADRDVIAMQLFGRGAEDLNPLIVEGSDVLRRYAKEADDVNYILSNESLEALAAVDDAYQRLQNTQEAVRNQIAAELAPAVEEFYTAWTQFIQTTAKEFVDSGILEGLGSILESIGLLIPALGDLISSILPDLGEELKDIAKVVDSISWASAGVADLIDLVDGIVNPLNWGSGKALNALGFGYSSGNPSNLQKWEMRSTGSYDAYQQRYNGSGGYTEDRVYNYDYSSGQYYRNSFNPPPGYTRDTAVYMGGKWYDKATGWEIPGYATGASRFPGGLALVGENGPEIVSLPEGTQIWNAQSSRNAGGDVFNISIPARDIKEFNDIVRIAESARILARMGG